MQCRLALESFPLEVIQCLCALALGGWLTCYCATAFIWYYYGQPPWKVAFPVFLGACGPVFQQGDPEKFVKICWKTKPITVDAFPKHDQTLELFLAQENHIQILQTSQVMKAALIGIFFSTSEENQNCVLFSATLKKLQFVGDECSCNHHHFCACSSVAHL